MTPRMILDPATDTCPICSAQNLTRYDAIAADAPDGRLVHITECSSCAFAWQFPLGRSESESVVHADANYQTRGEETAGYFNVDHKRRIATVECEFVDQLPAPGRRLLDFGAGAGIFAQVAAERGYTVTALDPALNFADTDSDTSVRAIRGKLDDLAADETFDIVTLWDVIEHLPDPLEILRQASDRLAPGGWLVVESGNYKSAARAGAARQHWMLALDHRWYFAPDSTEALMGHLGLNDFVHADAALRPGWSGHCDYPGPRVLALIKSLVKRPFAAPRLLARHSALQRAATWERAGVDIFAIAGRR